MRQHFVLILLAVLVGVPLYPQSNPGLSPAAGIERVLSGHWAVEIVQGGSVKAASGRGERGASAKLARKPFTIRVRMDQPIDVLLNVITSAATAERLKGGFDASRDCPPDDVVPTEETMSRFPCPGTTLAISAHDTTLLTGDSSHLLSADPVVDSWTRKREESGRWLLERDVTEINGRSLAEWQEPLMLVLVTRPAEGRLADENIRRVMLLFLDP